MVEMFPRANVLHLWRFPTLQYRRMRRDGYLVGVGRWCPARPCAQAGCYGSRKAQSIPPVGLEDDDGGGGGGDDGDVLRDMKGLRLLSLGFPILVYVTMCFVV